VVLNLGLRAETRIDHRQRIEPHDEECDSQARVVAGGVEHHRPADATQHLHGKLLEPRGDSGRERKELPAARERHGDVSESQQGNLRRQRGHRHGRSGVEADIGVCEGATDGAEANIVDAEARPAEPRRRLCLGGHQRGKRHFGECWSCRENRGRCHQESTADHCLPFPRARIARRSAAG